MKMLIVGKCAPEGLFALEDPAIPSEAEFTLLVITTLRCIFQKYECIPFTGRFHHEGNRFKPDLALVARDRSHWFVVEVELATHSLDSHVLPQVRAFRFGDPDPDCSDRLAEALKISVSEAVTLVKYVPRSVVVVANRRTPDWEHALRGVGAQFVVVSLYSSLGQQAVEFDGQIDMVRESMAFGRYSAVDRAVRFPVGIGLAEGEVQLDDSNGVAAQWIVRRSAEAAWLTRAVGEPDFCDGMFVQALRMLDGRIVLRAL